MKTVLAAIMLVAFVAAGGIAGSKTQNWFLSLITASQAVLDNSYPK